jgi:hypothetical protein
MKTLRGQIKEVMKRVEPKVQAIEVLPAGMMAKGQPQESESQTDHAARERREELRSN